MTNQGQAEQHIQGVDKKICGTTDKDISSSFFTHFKLVIIYGIRMITTYIFKIVWVSMGMVW